MKNRFIACFLVWGLVVFVGCDGDVSYADYAAPQPEVDTEQPDPPNDTDDGLDTPPEPQPEPLPPAEPPCITGGGGLEFGTVGIGQLSEQRVQFSNCGEQSEVEITSVSLSSDSDEAFFLAEAPETARLDPGESLSVVVALAPDRPATFTGTVVVVSDAGTLEVPLHGQGADVGCFTPTATARVQDSREPPSAQVEAIPLDTVLFDSRGSRDPNNPNSISRYEWTLVEQPTDSTTRFVPNENAESPTLFLDLAGRYVVELTTFDHQNTPSCEPARVIILATPDEDIHIQLVWDTDDTDMDLHFLHPNGRWNQSPYDCHWLNRSPNWANINNSDDDPSLDIDDVDGFGPENINLDNPEEALYRVGVHYYSDHALGNTNATVRV